jgi:hypothetical protein
VTLIVEPAMLIDEGSRAWGAPPSTRSMKAPVPFGASATIESKVTPSPAGGSRAARASVPAPRSIPQIYAASAVVPIGAA